MFQRALSILALFGFVCSLLASSVGSIVSTATEEFWEVKLLGSTHLGSTVQTDLDWSFGTKTTFEDIPRATTLAEGQLAIHLTASPLDLHFGSLQGDSRFSTLIGSGLALSFISGNQALSLGPPRVTKASLSPSEFNFWTLSIPASVRTSDLYVHLFTAGLPQYSIGSIAGILTESSLATGMVRIGTISVQSTSQSFDGPVHPYAALPIQRGLVATGSFSGRVVEVLPTLHFRFQFIFRYAYDEFMGSGVSMLSRLEVSWRELSLQYSRIMIPLWCGAVGERAFTTVDAPLKREQFSLSWNGGSLFYEMACTDTWWRTTAFAGDSQRRTLRFRGFCSYRPSRDFSVGVRASLERRWNRTGSEGQTLTAALPVEFSFHHIDLSVRPEVRWTADPIWSIQISIFIPTIRAFADIETAVEVRVKRSSSSVSLRFTIPLEQGRVMCELTPEGSVRIRYSTAL